MSLTFNGKTLCDRQGGKLGSFDGQFVYDSHGSKVGSIWGGTVYDANRNEIALVEGGYIYDNASDRNKIANMNDEVYADIEGSRDTAHGAVWLLLIPKSQRTKPR